MAQRFIKLTPKEHFKQHITSTNLYLKYSILDNLWCYFLFIDKFPDKVAHNQYFVKQFLYINGILLISFLAHLFFIVEKVLTLGFVY